MSHPAHHDHHHHTSAHLSPHPPPRRPWPTRMASGAARLFEGSVLGWPAWLRMLAVLPLVLLLWLGVGWANAGVSAW